jgi:hypothetical protein
MKNISGRCYFSQVFMAAMLAVLLLKPGCSYSGEISDWLLAAGLVVACHEGGHAEQARSLNVSSYYRIDVTGPHYVIDEAPLVGRALDFAPSVYRRRVAIINDFTTIEAASHLIPGPDPFKKYLFEKLAADQKALRAAIFEVNEPILRRSLAVGMGGFLGQQACEDRLSDPGLRKKYLIVSGALYKWGYAAFPRSLQPGVGTGDVEMFSKVGSEGFLRLSLAVSGASDVLRGITGQTSWSVDVSVSDGGTPGLMVRGKMECIPLVECPFI